MRNVTIIGGGPAGLTAAIYTARAGLAPLVFEGFMSGGQPGGQLMTTSEVENFPGFEAGVMGPDLIGKMRAQAIRFGAEVITEDVDTLELGRNPFVLSNSSRREESRTLIIATGARAKLLDLPSVKTFWGRGVSACATCDGALPMFRNQVIAVVGGGDSAIEEATFLTRFASQVVLIHRRKEFRASRIMQERVKKHPKIRLLLESTVTEVYGTKAVEGLKVKNVVSGEISDLPCRGFFMAIGHEPNTAFLKGALKTDEKGYLVVSQPSTRTSIPGLFACGDVIDAHYRQAITAAGSGCAAALDAERWLGEQESL